MGGGGGEVNSTYLLTYFLGLSFFSSEVEIFSGGGGRVEKFSGGGIENFLGGEELRNFRGEGVEKISGGRVERFPGGGQKFFGER